MLDPEDPYASFARACASHLYIELINVIDYLGRDRSLKTKCKRVYIVKEERSDVYIVSYEIRIV